MNIKKLLQFTNIVGKLKRLKRAGWVKYKVKNPETVAEHSFRLAILTMILAPKFKVDQLKAVKMALIHDIGETEIGDIITFDGTKETANLKDKIEAEKVALKNIFSIIQGNEYIALFNEFEEKKTKEAKLVKQLDKLEMAIQALEYESEQKLNLESFFTNSKMSIEDVYLKRILDELYKLRI